MAANQDQLKNTLATRQQAQAPAKAGGYGSVEALMKKYETEIVSALPGHIAGEQFLRLMLQEFRLNPALIQCEPASILGAVFTCARLGLEPGPIGYVYLIPRKIKGVMNAQVQIGYKGYVQLAYRTDRVESILPYTINENDTFEWHGGHQNEMIHEIGNWQDRGKVLGYYIVVRMKDGGNVVSRPWSAGEIEAHRKKHAQFDGLTPAWQKSYDVMAAKTVLRDMIRWMPMSTEMLSLSQADGATVKALPKAGQVPELAELIVDADYAEVDGDTVDTQTGEVVSGPASTPGEPTDADLAANIADPFADGKTTLPE